MISGCIRRLEGTACGAIEPWLALPQCASPNSAPKPAI
jgi:hypothetical protein